MRENIGFNYEIDGVHRISHRSTIRQNKYMYKIISRKDEKKRSKSIQDRLCHMFLLILVMEADGLNVPSPNTLNGTTLSRK